MDEFANSVSPEPGMPTSLPPMSGLAASARPPALTRPLNVRRGGIRSLLATKETRLSYAIICVALWSVCVYLMITNFIGGTIEVRSRQEKTVSGPG